MRLRTVLKIAVVVVVAAVVAAVAFVLSVDPNDYKDDIAEQVRKATGRTLAIRGPIGLDIGSPITVTADDVAFENAPWGSREQMATVGHAAASIALWPLFGGTVEIERLELRDADVLIETDAEGRSNLDFGGEESSGEDGGDVDVGVGQLQVRNVTVTMKDGQAGTTTTARLDRMIAAPPEPGAPLDVDIEGQVSRGKDVASIDLRGQVGSLESIVSGTAPVPVSLKGQLLGYDVLVDGGVRQEGAPDGVDVRIEVSGDGFGTIQPFVDTPLPKLGPISLTAHVTGSARSPVIGDIEAKAANTRITGKADLVLDEEEIGAEYTLKVALDGQDLGLLSPYVNLPLERLGPLTGSMNVVGDLDSVRLEPNAITADRSRLTGTIELGLAQMPPVVDYDLTLTADGQTLAVIEPFVGMDLPEIGPINGTIRAVGDRQKVRVEVSDVSAESSVLSGQIAARDLDRTPAVEFDVALKANGQSLAMLQPYLGEDVMGLGALRGGVKAKGTLDKAEIDLNEMTVDNTRVSGKISVDRTGEEPIANYDLTIAAENQTTDLFRAFVPGLPDLGELDVNLAMRGDASKASFENLSVKGEEIDLTGSGSVDLSGDKPRIEAQLASEILNIARYIPDDQAPSAPAVQSKEEAARSDPDAGRVFSSDPLPFDLLNAANADISLQARKLVTPKGEFYNVDTRIQLESGDLNARPLNLTYSDSPVTGDFSIETSGGTPMLAVSLRSPKVMIGELLKDFADLDVLRGTGTVNIALSGQGRSLAAIMGNLNGHARVLMGQGQMRNEGLGYVSGVFSGIGEILGRKEWVAVDCMAHDYEIANGIATARLSLLDTAVIRLAVDGNVDLGEERYRLKITPSPTGLDLSLAVPVDVRGPLADPSFSPNAIGTLTKLGSLFGSIAFPPAAIVGLTDLGGGDNPCVKFAETRTGDAGATPSSPLEGDSGGGGLLQVPGRALEGVGDLLGR